MTIVLVRHAEAVAPSEPRYEENDRPLTDAGRREAERLAANLGDRPVAAIHSSPYPRAIQTVEPLARRLGFEVGVIDDLRERVLAPGALPDWRERLQRSWAAFGHRLEGGESSAEAQERVSRVLADLTRCHGEDVIVAASHGNLIAPALHAIAPDRVDFAFWAAMPTPAVYVLPAAGSVSRPGFGD